MSLALMFVWLAMFSVGSWQPVFSEPIRDHDEVRDCFFGAENSSYLMWTSFQPRHMQDSLTQKMEKSTWTGKLEVIKKNTLRKNMTTLKNMTTPQNFKKILSLIRLTTTTSKFNSFLRSYNKSTSEAYQVNITIYQKAKYPNPPPMHHTPPPQKKIKKAKYKNEIFQQKTHF